MRVHGTALKGGIVRRTVLVWLLAFSVSISAITPVAFGQKPKKSVSTAVGPMPHGNVEAVTAAQLKDYLFFVASDEMEGRDTPSRGLNTTAKFIAMELSRAGLKPAGDDGTFFQRIGLRRFKVDQEKTRAELNGRSLKFGEDFSLSAAQLGPGSAEGQLVYVGNGFYYPSKNLNPYQGVQVKDKIAIVAGTAFPRGISRRDLSEGKEGVDWESPGSYLRKNGARGIVYLPSANYLSNWNVSVNALLESGTRWTVEKFQKQDGQSLPSIIASEKLATAILEGEKRDAATIIKGEAGEAFELSPSKQIKFSINVKSEQTNTQNVVAVLEGSDPKLKNEYVAIGAHYDHVGMGTPINGDGIWNGADDDGSGTVSVLSIAEAFAAGPRPKRSLLFVWHCGEEKGLWGSRYVTDYPLIPLNEIVAQLNIDMIGRSKHEGDTLPVNKDLTGSHEIYVIGSKMMSTDLGALSEQVNNSFLKLSFNYKYDDPKDPQRFFFRSDHYNYARKGIPIIFYFDGTHEDYHKPTDHPDKIDYQKMERVARTVLATAWELANRPERPKVDKQLPQELMGN